MSSNLNEEVDSSDTSYVLLSFLAVSSALFFVLHTHTHTHTQTNMHIYIYIYIYILLLIFSRFPLNSKEVDIKYANYMYSDSRARHM